MRYNPFEKLTVAQPAKKISRFYESRRYITVVSITE